MKTTVAKLAEFVEGKVVGDDQVEIQGVASLNNAGPGEIAFIRTPEMKPAADQSSASCILMPDSIVRDNKTCIQVASPKYAFLKIVELFHPPWKPDPGVHPSAIIADSAEIADDVAIGPFVVIGEGARIGKGTILCERVSVGHRSVIGENCTLYPNVVLYQEVTLGNRVILHAGCVIGCDGFGYVLENGRHHKLPQVGTVRIEDDVECGAVVCIDRGTLDETVIGRGTKIDNLGHIAHNVQIGNDCALAAQVGIAGSSQIQDRVTLGGKVGAGDYSIIEEGAIVGGGAGVPSGKRIHAGQLVWGLPARPFKRFKEQHGALSRLPHWNQEIVALKKRMAALEEEFARQSES